MDIDRPLADVADDDPERLIREFSKLLEGADDGESVVLLAGGIARSGVNIFRLMREHPDITADIFDEEPPLSQELIDEMDEIANAEVE